jgi:hypothetical protein
LPHTVTSTAFLGGSQPSPDQSEIRTRLAALTQTVRDSLARIVETLDSLDTVLVGHHALGQLMHAHGVNVRYLGELASRLTVPAVRDHVVVEIVARTAKHLLMRAYSHGRPLQVDKVIDFFNLVLGESTVSTKFWAQVLIPEAVKRFKSPKEFLERKRVRRGAVFHALQYHAGIRFHDPATLDVRSPLQAADLQPSSDELMPHHVEGLPPGWVPKMRAVFPRLPWQLRAAQAGAHLKAGRLDEAYKTANLALEISARLGDLLAEPLTAVAHTLLRMSESSVAEDENRAVHSLVQARQSVAVAALAVQRYPSACFARTRVLSERPRQPI